ncbi:Ubiquitin-conjugating enzyme E2-24 kDa [Daphnia magna]|uniref:Ubiquitin-conjugating enzyme E2-24 kDa n=1 Tax=Daphnia magna TaxID=35525 RepID=A0A164ZA31_9CRUS|nr:Ubiquitin-conjugating enzyme E2-24 kDa [Daphnia magna]
MSTSGAGPSSSSRVQHQQGSNSSSGQTEANGNTTPPPQSSANTAATATPPVKEAKEAKPNPKMSKALSTSAKRIQKELAEITLDPPPNCRSAWLSLRGRCIFP